MILDVHEADEAKVARVKVRVSAIVNCRAPSGR